MTIPKHYSVQTFDAYESPPYSGDPLDVGSFSTAEEALECAKKVVDDQLRSSIESGLSAEEALLSFSTAGEIPMIFGEDRIYLQPFEYAKKRAPEIASKAASFIELLCMSQPFDLLYKYSRVNI